MRLLARAVASSDELDDVTLARAQRGEPAAFRELVVCYQQRVFACLWRILGARAERGIVEDLTQDTFVKVHRGLARFRTDGPARLGTWVLTIATRVALNHLRRAPAPRVDEPEPGGPDVALALAVRAALEQLTPDHRAVLVLREYHGLDYEEIAAALAIEIGTVRSRLARARAALRALLSEES
jgi:RNA polymerase sigma-70 factor, ECF subfamily